MVMAGKKRPAWVTAQVDQRMAEIRDECDLVKIDLLDDGVGAVVNVLLACIESAHNAGLVELYVEMDAWKEITK
jgi:hypothetical protein